MHIFVTLEQLKEFYLSVGFNILDFTIFEQLVVLILSNILWIIGWAFIIKIVYMILLRLKRFIFGW